MKGREGGREGREGQGGERGVGGEALLQKQNKSNDSILYTLDHSTNNIILPSPLEFCHALTPPITHPLKSLGSLPAPSTSLNSSWMIGDASSKASTHSKLCASCHGLAVNPGTYSSEGWK